MCVCVCVCVCVGVVVVVVGLHVEIYIFQFVHGCLFAELVDLHVLTNSIVYHAVRIKFLCLQYRLVNFFCCLVPRRVLMPTWWTWRSSAQTLTLWQVSCPLTSL